MTKRKTPSPVGGNLQFMDQYSPFWQHERQIRLFSQKNQKKTILFYFYMLTFKLSKLSQDLD
jgi:hypothetical protein